MHLINYYVLDRDYNNKKTNAHLLSEEWIFPKLLVYCTTNG